MKLSTSNGQRRGKGAFIALAISGLFACNAAWAINVQEQDHGDKWRSNDDRQRIAFNFTHHDRDGFGDKFDLNKLFKHDSDKWNWQGTEFGKSWLWGKHFGRDHNGEGTWGDMSGGSHFGRRHFSFDHRNDFGDRFDDWRDYCQVPIPSPVPEPSSIMLLLAGLGVVGFMAKRRKYEWTQDQY